MYTYFEFKHVKIYCQYTKTKPVNIKFNSFLKSAFSFKFNNAKSRYNEKIKYKKKSRDLILYCRIYIQIAQTIVNNFSLAK